MIAKKNIQNHEAVISYPAYYTESEKRALIESCKIANIKPTRIISE